MSITFFKPKQDKIEPKKGYWNNQDIADFYRAVDLLEQAGLNTEVDSGLTDEGDPWFVFMRPETGEVIAHFAQIDGRFIAVSSLNQEVYKGRDIRSIVDQMLERHPMLLPQNKNSGRLMLHPTAALSAFLAAAFILTIDGVKASNLTDVIVSATSQQGSLTINNEATWIPYGQRSEILKGMFSELNLVNYNVAVLGAALIARELSHNEMDLKPNPGEEDSPVMLNNGEKEKVESGDLKFNINLEHDRDSSEGGHTAYSIRSESSSVSNEEGDHAGSQDEFGRHQNDKGADNTLGSKESANEDGGVFLEEYEVLWSHSETALKNNYQSIQHVSSNNANEQFASTREPEIISRDEPYGSNLDEVLASLQESFQIVPSSFRSEALLRSDGLGITFNSAGELELIPLNSIAGKNFKSEPVRFDFAPTEQLEPIVGPEPFVEESELFDAPSENDLGSDSQAEQIVYRKPIIGHSLKKIDHTLLLTDAIDVVFYEGGDSEISGFDLGTDLLWFFLSEEELETANNSVNHNGDLVLDFGDTGTLTFLGMVPDKVIDGIA